MDEPLNRDLYDRLRLRYGRVLITNEGEAAVPHLDITAVRHRVTLDPGGEMYRVCCPLCARRGTPDTRFRLYINHRWGVGHPLYPNDDFWWAAHCFNEQCTSDPANRKLLRSEVYDDVGRAVRRNIVVTVGEAACGPATVKQLPGVCRPLFELPDTHPARAFIRMRGFDPDVVGLRYDLQFCVSVPYEKYQLYPAVNRIVAPFKIHGRLLGWQARFVGNAKLNSVAKYFTCPGMRTSKVLYDFDNARLSPVVFICEGITDVWAVGTGAVAICGKHFSNRHFDMILEHWNTAVVLLDAGAENESSDIYNKLSKCMRVIRVVLPQQTDPAALDKDFLWERIYTAGVQAGCDLVDLVKRTVPT